MPLRIGRNPLETERPEAPEGGSNPKFRRKEMTIFGAGTRYRTGSQARDQDHQDRSGGEGIAEERNGPIVGQAVGHDAGSDHGSDEQGHAGGFGRMLADSITLHDASPPTGPGSARHLPSPLRRPCLGAADGHTPVVGPRAGRRALSRQGPGAERCGGPGRFVSFRPALRGDRTGCFPIHGDPRHWSGPGTRPDLLQSARDPPNAAPNGTASAGPQEQAGHSSARRIERSTVRQGQHRMGQGSSVVVPAMTFARWRCARPERTCARVGDRRGKGRRPIARHGATGIAPPDGATGQPCSNPRNRAPSEPGCTGSGHGNRRAGNRAASSMPGPCRISTPDLTIEWSCRMRAHVPLPRGGNRPWPGGHTGFRDSDPAGVDMTTSDSNGLVERRDELPREWARAGDLRLGSLRNR